MYAWGACIQCHYYLGFIGTTLVVALVIAIAIVVAYQLYVIKKQQAQGIYTKINIKCTLSVVVSQSGDHNT